ncbi:hypothetical protein JCM8547_000360 [Rhodosporidiobolus lusitaniae]
MRPHGLCTALATLLLAAVAQASAPGAVNVAAVSPISSGLIPRFLETVAQLKPESFHDFVHHLTSFQQRTKVVFSNPVFASKGKTLEGKPRPNPYDKHNPIFTHHALPNETHAALEASLARSFLFRGRTDFALLRYAFASGVGNDVLEKMEAAWEKREGESGVEENKMKTCESWVDVGGKKVCNFDELWKLLGRKQQIERTPLKIEGETLELYDFDHLLPTVRDESLPLVVLYAAPTDEAFPPLYEGLYALAKPKYGKPRVQFAIRWKLDSEAPETHWYPDFAAEATVKSGLEIAEVKDVADFSARAIAYIKQASSAKDRLNALVDVSTSLPTVASEIANTSPLSTETLSSLEEQLLINGVSFDPSTLSAKDLLSLLQRDITYFETFAKSHSGLFPEGTKEIFVNSAVAIEEPRKTASSLAIPTIDHPLQFVDLSEAYKNLTGYFSRASYIEGVAEGNGEVDPPAVATVHVVTDLDSDAGLALVKNALMFLAHVGEVRLGFVHNPSSTSPAPHRFAFSHLVAKLINNEEWSEVYADELTTFLNLNASPENPPKRSLDDSWTQENPITPFVEKGAEKEDEEVSEKYWKDAKRFVERIGVKKGTSAVLLNGRLIHLESDEFATGSFHALLQYELKRRIRPVVAAAQPVLSDRLKADRKLQADLYSMASSAIASMGVERKVLTAEQVKGLPSFSTGTANRTTLTITAVLDPLSPFGRAIAPLLEQLSALPLTHLKVYLKPSTLSSVDLTTLSGRAFAVRTQFDNFAQEVKPVVNLACGLPAGVVLENVRATLPGGEELAGPGGPGGETVKVEKEGQVKEIVFAKVEVKGAKKAEGHVRDEL